MLILKSILGLFMRDFRWAYQTNTAEHSQLVDYQINTQIHKIKQLVI